MKKFDPRENLPLKYVALLSAMLIVMTMNPPPAVAADQPLDDDAGAGHHGSNERNALPGRVYCVACEPKARNADR